MFASLLAGDIQEFRSHVDEFSSSLLAYEQRCVNYRQEWVIKRVLKLVRFSVSVCVLFPGYAMIKAAAKGMYRLVPTSLCPNQHNGVYYSYAEFNAELSESLLCCIALSTTTTPAFSAISDATAMLWRVNSSSWFRCPATSRRSFIV